jgi:hypothetical protein
VGWGRGAGKWTGGDRTLTQHGCHGRKSLNSCELVDAGLTASEALSQFQAAKFHSTRGRLDLLRFSIVVLNRGKRLVEVNFRSYLCWGSSENRILLN